jgi:hypothetical protein
MPFREKSAWISLACLLPFTLFFAAMGSGMLPWHGFRALHFFLMAVIAFVVLQILLRVIAALLAPKDAKAPVDERERLIGLKATRNGYIALVVGIVVVPLSMHLGAHGPGMAYVAMFALLASEIVRAASQIALFRMGR